MTVVVVGTLLVVQNRFKSIQSTTMAKRACTYGPDVINSRPMQQAVSPGSDTAACASSAVPCTRKILLDQSKLRGG